MRLSYAQQHRTSKPKNPKGVEWAVPKLTAACVFLSQFKEVSTMSSFREESLKRQLQKELQESEWLQKFKQLSEGLCQIKAEIPLTQLCQLRWESESHTLIIHCPNLEVQEGLHQQKSKIEQLNIVAKRFILKHPQSQDIIIEAQG